MRLPSPGEWGEMARSQQAAEEGGSRRREEIGGRNSPQWNGSPNLRSNRSPSPNGSTSSNSSTNAKRDIVRAYNHVASLRAAALTAAPADETTTMQAWSGRHVPSMKLVSSLIGSPEPELPGISQHDLVNHGEQQLPSFDRNADPREVLPSDLLKENGMDQWSVDLLHRALDVYVLGFGALMDELTQKADDPPEVATEAWLYFVSAAEQVVCRSLRGKLAAAFGRNRTRIDSLEKENQRLHNDAYESRIAAEKAVARSEQFDRARQEAEERMNEAVKREESLLEENEKLNDIVRTTQEERDVAEKEQERLMVDMEAKKDSLEENEKLKDKVEQLREEIHRAHSRGMEAVRESKEEAEKRCEELEAELADRSEALDAKARHVASLTKKMDDLRNELDTERERRRQAYSAKDASDAQVESIRKRLHEAQDKALDSRIEAVRDRGDPVVIKLHVDDGVERIDLDEIDDIWSPSADEGSPQENQEIMEIAKLKEEKRRTQGRLSKCYQRAVQGLEFARSRYNMPNEPEEAVSDLAARFAAMRQKQRETQHIQAPAQAPALEPGDVGEPSQDRLPKIVEEDDAFTSADSSPSTAVTTDRKRESEKREVGDGAELEFCDASVQTESSYLPSMQGEDDGADMTMKESSALQLNEHPPSANSIPLDSEPEDLSKNERNKEHEYPGTMPKAQPSVLGPGRRRQRSQASNASSNFATSKEQHVDETGDSYVRAWKTNMRSQSPYAKTKPSEAPSNEGSFERSMDGDEVLGQSISSMKRSLHKHEIHGIDDASEHGARRYDGAATSTAAQDDSKRDILATDLVHDFYPRSDAYEPSQRGGEYRSHTSWRLHHRQDNFNTGISAEHEKGLEGEEGDEDFRYDTDALAELRRRVKYGFDTPALRNRTMNRFTGANSTKGNLRGVSGGEIEQEADHRSGSHAQRRLGIQAGLPVGASKDGSTTEDTRGSTAGGGPVSSTRERIESKHYGPSPLEHVRHGNSNLEEARNLRSFKRPIHPMQINEQEELDHSSSDDDEEEEERIFGKQNPINHGCVSRYNDKSESKSHTKRAASSTATSVKASGNRYRQDTRPIRTGIRHVSAGTILEGEAYSKAHRKSSIARREETGELGSSQRSLLDWMLSASGILSTRADAVTNEDAQMRAPSPAQDSSSHKHHSQKGATGALRQHQNAPIDAGPVSVRLSKWTHGMKRSAMLSTIFQRSRSPARGESEGRSASALGEGEYRESIRARARPNNFIQTSRSPGTQIDRDMVVQATNAAPQTTRAAPRGISQLRMRQHRLSRPLSINAEELQGRRIPRGPHSVLSKPAIHFVLS